MKQTLSSLPSREVPQQPPSHSPLPRTRNPETKLIHHSFKSKTLIDQRNLCNFIWTNTFFHTLFFSEKFHSNLRPPAYQRPKGPQQEFTIQHYAGNVTYSVANMLEKNKNFLPSEVIFILRQSDEDIIRYLNVNYRGFFF